MLHDDVLYFRQGNDENCLLCVPAAITDPLVQAYHEALGHFGVYKCWLALKSEVWWTNMSRDVKRVIKRCDICQKAKCTMLPKPPLQPIVASERGEIVALDIYGPLPKSRASACYLLVVLDRFTKHVSLYPLRRATTRACLNRLTTDYFATVGRPKKILSDHGTQFSTKKWKIILESLGVQVMYSSVRHPQANPSERVMRELGRLFRTFCHEKHTRWAFEVRDFSHLLNSVKHETTGFAPNELQFGAQSLKLLPKHFRPFNADLDFAAKLTLAQGTLEGKAARRALKHPGRPYHPFQPGELVLLRNNPVSSVLEGITKKLLFEGPYRIKKRIGLATYILTRSDNTKRGMFHASHLRLYCSDKAGTL